MSYKVQQSVCSDCVTYVKSRIKFNTFNTFNNVVELKAVEHTTEANVRQLWHYMHITHTEYGMLINFGSQHLYSAWYRRDPVTGYVEKVKLL